MSRYSCQNVVIFLLRLYDLSYLVLHYLLLTYLRIQKTKKQTKTKDIDKLITESNWKKWEREGFSAQNILKQFCFLNSSLFEREQVNRRCWGGNGRRWLVQSSLSKKREWPINAIGALHYFPCIPLNSSTLSILFAPPPFIIFFSISNI